MSVSYENQHVDNRNSSLWPAKDIVVMNLLKPLYINMNNECCIEPLNVLYVQLYLMN